MLEVLHTQRESEKVRYEASMAEYGSVFGLLEDVRGVINAKLVAKDGEFLESKMTM